MDGLASRNADFSQNLAEEGAFISMSGAMLVDVDFYAGESVELGARYRRLLAAEPRERNARGAIFSARGAADDQKKGSQRAERSHEIFQSWIQSHAFIS
ncbi:hypothetical protein MPC1_7860003 [Methylocella tundrae]|nr:hypothetical protein MPC1_7860003 [Methylocella tundrae]